MHSLASPARGHARGADRRDDDGEDAMSGIDHAQYLTFMLNGEMFAIGILAVKEIIEYGGLTEVPMMPPCLRGVINLRGAVVPVMDLSARFGRPPTLAGKRTCIVIVELEGEDGARIAGVVVDAVNAVLDMAAAEIEPAPTFGSRIRTDFIDGMGKVDGKFVVLLKLDSVLSMPEPEPEAPAAGAIISPTLKSEHHV